MKWICQYVFDLLSLGKNADEKQNERGLAARADTFFIAPFKKPFLPAIDFHIRSSNLLDIDAMVSLSKDKRMLYEKAQPQFWCYAGEKGDDTQRLWFKELLGFVIGPLIAAPQVYYPGGLTLMIDDFCVSCVNLWQSVGAGLIAAIKAAAMAKGATQIVVVCGAHDHSKRQFLSEQDLSIASMWFVGEVV